MPSFALDDKMGSVPNHSSSISTKAFVREKKSATEKERAAETFNQMITSSK
jgi:hypothetical protein